MQINSISLCKPNICNFKAKQNVKSSEKYENPVDRKTEKNLAILSSIGGSALIGATAFGITTCLKDGRKIPGIVGAIAAGVTLLLTLPSALYNTKISSFTREKEMDVYSRKNKAQQDIYDGLNKQIIDPNVSLEQNIRNYTMLTMADNGKGMMIQGA